MNAPAPAHAPEVSERLRLAQAMILDRASTSTSLEVLFHDIAVLVESLAPGVACMLARVDLSAGCLVQIVAPGVSERLRTCFDHGRIAEGHGCAGTAAARLAPVMVDDVLADPAWIHLRDAQRQGACDGVRASWSLPFFDAQRELVGVFTLLLDQPRAPSPFERELVEFAARLSGMACDRHFTLKALRDSEALHRAVFDATPEAIVTIDQRGTILACNRAAERMFGYSSVEMLGRHVAMLMEERVAVQHDHYVARHTAGNSPVRLHRGRAVHARRKDGTLFPIESTISEVTLDERLCFIAMLQDASELAAADEARRANRAKSDFLARMSHELRTPLNAIMGFAQLMALPSAGAAPATPQYAQHILDASRHLLSLINEVLDLSAIESGRVSIDLAVHAVHSLIDDCVRLLQPTAQARDIMLTVVVHPRAPTRVRADATRLRQVLMNLLSNAIKYNHPHGRVDVAVSPGATSDALAISVADTGPGLSTDQLQKIFEPFERLGREHSSVEGTGIGLTIARGLVRGMGGELAVRSRLGQGTEFTVELPAGTDAGEMLVPTGYTQDVTATTPLIGRDLPVPTPYAPARLLYIEDNPISALLIETYCARLQHLECHVAKTGAEGIALAQTLNPALIITDLRLPDMDGHEVLERLRALPALRRVRVVALSANAMADDLALARARGFNAYWTKPISPDVFAQGVASLLGGR